VIGKNHLEFSRRAAGDFDLDIAPGANRRIFTRVFAAHVHPADETVCAIDDLELPMIPQSESPLIAQRMRGAEPGKLTSGLDQPRKVEMPHPETANGIEQQAHFYASTRSGGEAVEHFVRPRI